MRDRTTHKAPRARGFRWARYPRRICRTLHECAICQGEIVAGEAYRDGGYRRRAHERCVAAGGSA